jgi:hypothetical protein
VLPISGGTAATSLEIAIETDVAPGHYCTFSQHHTAPGQHHTAPR